MILVVIDSDVFINKSKIFLSKIDLRVKKDKNDIVWASSLLIVNNLSKCPFNGEMGDIYIRNKNCSWSDYHCTLTRTDLCNGYMQGGNPIAEACYDEGNTEVACIGTTPSGHSFCYNVNRTSGDYYAVPCALCVIK